MAGKSRRKLIKGLGISVPTVWAAPVIEALVLPVHAQTTGECSVSEDCFESDTNQELFFDWPGGTAADDVVFRRGGCSGSTRLIGPVVLAHDPDEAADLFSELLQEDIPTIQVLLLLASPEGAGGCNFYWLGVGDS